MTSLLRWFGTIAYFNKMDDDILDIDEVLTDSFYMPSEECYNDIQNIVQQWKNNESAPTNAQNECTRYFDTRTFTRQKKRLNSTTNGLSDLDYPKSVGFPVDNNQSSCRNFIIDSSPSNSLCSYASDDATSLITSGDFSNVSYFINNANDITLQFNELDLKRADDTHSSSSTDTSHNSTAKRIGTHNEFLSNTMMVRKSSVSGDITISPKDERNCTHTVPTANRTFEKEFKLNSTFEKKFDDTFDEISGKIAHTGFVVPRKLDKYDNLNMVQSTPKVSRIQTSARSATPPNLSPINPKKFLFGEIPNHDDDSNTFIADMPLDMEGSMSNDEQQNSLVNFEEFEKSIFLDDDKCDEDFETLLDRMGNSKRLENREVMKESLDNIKKRHSLLNLEIKQEHQREKMNNHSGDNKSLVSSLHKSIPDERLLKRSRLFDNVTLNTSTDKGDRSISATTVHLDSNRTFNNQSAQRNNSNHQYDNADNDVCNSTVLIEKSPKPPIEDPADKQPPEIEDEQPVKYDNRDRFKTIRLFKKPAVNAVVITDAQTQFIEPAPIKTTTIAPKHIEPVSRLKSRQISTVSSRDSYMKSSSVENLNSRGFQKLKADANVAKSSSTQSLDKTSGLPKTSMLRTRPAAVPKNVKPNNVQNVIQKSIPVFNSRPNVNKLSGLVRPSSGYYSYNTDVEKFEAVNNAQPSGDSTFISNNVINDEPKQQPSRIAKPSGLRPPSKISCLPRPMSKR
ncbi:uncharacterized protein LOC119069052 isoform X1 [Bradysia coprophila]|uniref:uncharacterized protein LOC119069052 isoform X1 n=2 Tax=Bradysia coprophila TaxID=38358 RepID=UPI00187DCC5F|nr:uncharacterized protein LOC119069052 isoform X1 [Bradysia coprophila]